MLLLADALLCSVLCLCLSVLFVKLSFEESE